MFKRPPQQLAFWLVAAAVLTITCYTPFHAYAQTTWHVDDDAPEGGDGVSWDTAFNDLQDALLHEDLAAEDQIRVAGGTYKPDDESPWERAKTFQLVSGVGVYGGYAGRGAPDPNERDPDTYVSYLSGQLSGSIRSFHVVTGSGVDASAVLDGFTLQYGNANGAIAQDKAMGAGMFNDTGSPTVHNCIFRLNYASGSTGGEGGAGMYNRSSSPHVTACIFIDNQVPTGYGGGMLNRLTSNPTVEDCRFVSNTAGTQPDTAYAAGAGMYNRGSSPIVKNCIFEGNKSGHDEPDRDYHDGAAVRNDDGSNPEFENCIFTGNHAATGHGGAIANRNSCSSSIDYCTFAGNSATSGGNAIYSAWSSTAVITGCILWDGGGEIFNEHSSTATITYSDVQGGNAGQGNINADPLFVDPDNDHYYLEADSPCIDKAHPSSSPESDIEGTPRPLDGDAVPGARADMGAYEFDPNTPRICVTPMQVVFVSYEGGPNPDDQMLLIRNCAGDLLDWEVIGACGWLTADPTSGQSAGEIDKVTLSVDISQLSLGQYDCTLDVVDPEASNSPRSVQVTLHVGQVWYVDDETDPQEDGSYEHPFDTIQEAVDAADAFDTVLVLDSDQAPDFAYTGAGNRDIDFHGRDLIVRSENGPANCTIDCQGGPGGNEHRAFYLHSGETASAVIDGFTIINGYAPGAVDARFGGGIYCNLTDPTIRNCVFSGNVAEVSGGAIYCYLADGDSTTVLNCRFSGNEARRTITFDGGGGLHCTSDEEADTAITVVNCVFEGNWGLYGGGLLVRYTTATVTNCTFLDNQTHSTYGVGGGMYIADSNETSVTNCSFTENTARDATNFRGAAIFVWDCEERIPITNCIAWGNVPSAQQINYNGYDPVPPPDVNYCDVEDGTGEPWFGEGCIDVDPNFVDPVAGDLHLDSDSRCIAAGDTDALPADSADLDDDGDTVEPIPYDLDGEQRVKRCRIDMGAYEWGCKADLDGDGDTDLSDLAQLLGNYGTTSGATFEDGDVYACDGAVDLSDLAELVGDYGCIWGARGGGEGGGGGRDSSHVTLTVEAYDTHGYTGGGFNGEVDHFVFDLKIEVNDPNNDDWLVSGAVLDAENDATFRLSSSPTTPNKYATFVAAPWTTVPKSATANVAGAYDPADPNEVFTTTEVNLGWYDTDTDSDDGPAAVTRLVIDVSEVEGADVSEGFGSVYFSTSGPTGVNDIRVAQLSWGTGTFKTLPYLKSLTGDFYVKGE